MRIPSTGTACRVRQCAVPELLCPVCKVPLHVEHSSDELATQQYPIDDFAHGLVTKDKGKDGEVRVGGADGRRASAGLDDRAGDCAMRGADDPFELLNEEDRGEIEPLAMALRIYLATP